MATRNHRKDTEAWSLSYNGAFTWNKKRRTLCFMRAGDPKAVREEMRAANGFIVEGDDIKKLYQVLHQHYMEPRNVTRDWSPDLEVPPNAFSERHGKPD